MDSIIIGQTVAVKSHPFTSESTNIIISGESLMLPPLMIVCEAIIYKDASDNIDYQNSKCKCIWYSSKRNQFEEDWFLSSQLTIIANPVDQNNIVINDLVALKTLQIELGKKKSHLNTELQATGALKHISSITSILSFLSPVVQCIEIKDFDVKYALGQGHNTTHEKLYPSKMVKCKWFNSVSEKFSEKFIPIEALYKLPVIADSLITEIQTAIKKGRVFKLKNTLIRPQHIENRSGYYKVIHYDYLTNKTEEIDISRLNKIKKVTKFYKNRAPVFDIKKIPPVTLSIVSKEIETLIDSALRRRKRNYLRIKYKGSMEDITIRTIKDYEIVMVNDVEKGKPQIKFIRAYCLLRKAIRNFKVENILEVTELDLAH